MHELSLAQSMLRIVSEQLGAPRELLSATVTIGPFSGVEPEALRFCFTEIAKTMGFGEPELVINSPVLAAQCGDCGADYEVKSAFDFCPKCSSMNRHLDGGYEFTLDSIEIMEDDGEEDQH